LKFILIYLKASLYALVMDISLVYGEIDACSGYQNVIGSSGLK
jgi:hypothetical protein